MKDAMKQHKLAQDKVNPKMRNEFEVTQTTLKMWRNRWGGTPKCRRCSRTFQLGDVVISVSQGNRSRVKRYHKKCYEEMFY